MDAVRHRALRSLRRISVSRIHSKRPMSRTPYPKRSSAKQSVGSWSIPGEHPPVRSIPLGSEGVAWHSVQGLRGDDTEKNLDYIIRKTVQEYEKLQASKAPSHREESLFKPSKRIKLGSEAETQEANENKTEPQAKPKTDVEYIKIGDFEPFHPAFLRDACQCEKCVDPSSKQKNFQSTDIPRDLKAATVDVSPEGTANIVWENDVPGFELGHKSVFSKEFFVIHSNATEQTKARFQRNARKLWNKETIAKKLEYVDYEKYMNTDEGLFQAVQNLHSYGLLLVRGVPESEKSVEEIANRIGNLRDTFYGRTWDVKSVPQAKNVAYTAQFLGLHMDLLYMSDPPGFQFLHCLQNTCEGGSSLFSDAMHAASKLSPDSFYKLAKLNLAYHYKNAGEHYYFRHPVIDVPQNFFDQFSKEKKHHNVNRVAFINYSPPFQANHIYTGSRQYKTFPDLLDAMREFSSLVESEENLYEYRLQEGECVIFNNRRVLHGRRQFDTTAGSRWLKGAYIDTDVFMSKYRVLSEKFAKAPPGNQGRRFVNYVGSQR